MSDWSEDDLISMGKAVADSYTPSFGSIALTGYETEADWEPFINSARGYSLLLRLEQAGFVVYRKPTLAPTPFHKIGPKGHLP